jgi:CheY-like chemotaxis protein
MSGGIARILAVEDDPDIRTIISLALKLDPEMSVDVTGDGASALRRLDQSPSFDLVLIDDHLPDIDGISLAAAIRGPGRAGTRIVFLTASVRPSDHARFMAAGAIGVIAKPFDPFALASEVRAMLATASGSPPT